MNDEEFAPDKQEIENAHRVAYLIATFIKKTLTPRERRELDAWVGASEQHVVLFEELIQAENQQKTLDWYRQLDTERRLQRLKGRLHPSRPVKRLWSIAAAASVLLVAGIGSYLLFVRNHSTYTAPLSHNPAAASPVANQKVWLRLDDGTSISLDSAANGQLAGAAGAVIEGNALLYQPNQQTQTAFHTLSTATGMQYHVVLPDGTGVWLNAQSSLRYPTAFVGTERLVALTGEAYFEVAKDAHHPFKVQSGGVVTEVLGTVFNTQAYQEENSVITTLLEGSVKITNGANSRKLSPGQQAEVSNGSIQVSAADTDAAIGWKNGTFVFRKAPLASVLRELQRWYGIKIVNKHGVAIHLTATVNRNLTLEKVLQLLEDTEDLHFKRNGTGIEVLP